MRGMKELLGYAAVAVNRVKGMEGEVAPRWPRIMKGMEGEVPPLRCGGRDS